MQPEPRQHCNSRPVQLPDPEPAVRVALSLRVGSALLFPLCLTHPIPPRRYYTLSAEASFYPMPNARPCYPNCPTGQVQPDEVTSAMCAACKRVDIDLHLPACRRRTSQQGLEASRRRGSKASKRRPGPAARIMPPRASRLKTSLAAPSEQTGPVTAPPSGPLEREAAAPAPPDDGCQGEWRRLSLPLASACLCDRVWSGSPPLGAMKERKLRA